MSNGNGRPLGADIARPTGLDDLIVIAGAGGFIAGALTRYFSDLGYRRIRAIDRKPLPEWYQHVPGVESLSMDLSKEANAIRAVEGAAEVYNLAADMGGMGFIERFRVECLRSVLINTNLIEAAYRAGVAALFLLLLRVRLQHRSSGQPGGPSPQGIRRLPGDGGARLRLGEADLGDVLPGVLGRARARDAYRALPQHLRPVRHLGRRPGKGARRDLPQGRSRPRTPATTASTSGATARRPAASATSTTASSASTGSCTATQLIATPVNLGSSELVSINELVSMVEEIAGVKLERTYDLGAPKGVAGRNSDNTFIESVLGWEPRTPLRDGMAETYRWIAGEYAKRKAGRPVAVG